MINRQQLLADLQKFLKRIEADLLERSESTEVPEVPAALHAEYEKAAKAERTAQNYEDWRTDTITQAAAAWVLSCVFVRFLEDNSLIDPPKIAGPGERLARARDEHELYFRSYPQHTDREYLLSIFGDLAKLPGTKDIFGEHNAINDLPNWLSGDAAGELLNFFQKIDASTGDLVHDFTDPNWDTRFLGDLYQDLSEAARKKFALLQTPDFVEEFILDRTLDPAIEEFGLVPMPLATNQQSPACFKMIDPACGSGHFLLGTFPRLLERWQRKEPGTNVRELTQRALDSIHGVDINPFAVAIAKFRLLLAALKACNIERLGESPGFRIHVACGDSLLHGENRTSTGQKMWDYAEGATDEELYSHAYPGEDLQTARTLLKPNTYHCVVANPPYIVPKDRKLNDWYRKRFSACGGKYSLSVPFMQQIFQLAMQDGFTGQITANSFMKREFGKKLIESFFPTIDLTHVIDASGAYIPGHGTPTTIVFGRNRIPISNELRTILGIRGEPTTPINPAKGLVWMSIVASIDRPGTQDDFISSSDSIRTLFHAHPWSIGGGGASELKKRLEDESQLKLSDQCDTMICLVTLEDDAYAAPEQYWKRCKCEREETAGFVEGDMIRDWEITRTIVALFPHDWKTRKPSISEAASRRLWLLKPNLSRRLWFSKTQLERGLQWYEYGMVSGPAIASPLSIAYGEISTHNHFVLDRGGKLFKQTAPVIKLKVDATEIDHLNLLGLLNSSTACFWMKQVAHNKGDSTDQHGARTIGDPAFNTYAFNGTLIGKLPLPEGRPLGTAKSLDQLAHEFSLLSPKSILTKWRVGDIEDNDFEDGDLVSLSDTLLPACKQWESIRQKMIACQENLDWECYKLYGIIGDNMSEANSESSVSLWFPISLGQRAFEIVLARKVASGESQSTWFERHGSTPITELPAEWPEDYKKLVERRIELIENDPNIRLIEQPEYKRRWNTESWESQLERALREWLLLRLETYFDFDGRMIDDVDTSNKPMGNEVALGEIAMYSVAQLADAARRDPQFMEVGELYRDDPAFDVQALVEELVLAESVPHLPVLRYKDSGLRKRAEWEKTWDLQRREDAGESVGTIPVPPKYTSVDFISTGGARYWSLRGKLDVPKERWISFPHCEGPDGTLVICWAGYDHLQQAQAISAYYVRVQTEFGGSDDPRLIPLLASLIELLPWLKQWHNEPNANFDGLRMGDYFEGFVNEEARALGKTLEEIRAWTPPKGQRGRVAKGQSGKRKGQSRKGSKGQSEEGENQ
jgi:type I restriction-modification system DNA methylase subunit